MVTTIMFCGRPIILHRRLLLVVAVVAMMVASSYLFDDNFSISEHYYYYHNEEDHYATLPQERDWTRSLTANTNSTLTVYLTDEFRKPNPAFSIFKTDTLQRYGSGRFNFAVKELRSACSCKKPPALPGTAPCLVATNGRFCFHEHIKCMFPECKSMISSDEECKHSWADVREYYSSSLTNEAYLPLGPRWDSWKSFQNIQSSTQDFHIAPPSKRKYAFNAIFSQSTNMARQRLAELIDNQQGGTDSNSNLPVFTHMAKEWNRDANSPHTEQLHTEEYMKVVLDSVFTLAPAGHNPECFRLFEAVEAGSIPIIAKRDLNTAWRCKGSLDRWLDAPIIILEDWSELYPTVDKLMGDLEALDDMQVKLRMWYDEYMKKTMVEFEDFMLELYSMDGMAESNIEAEVRENPARIALELQDTNATEFLPDADAMQTNVAEGPPSRYRLTHLLQSPTLFGIGAGLGFAWFCLGLYCVCEWVYSKLVQARATQLPQAKPIASRARVIVSELQRKHQQRKQFQAVELPSNTRGARGTMV